MIDDDRGTDPDDVDFAALVDPALSTRSCATCDDIGVDCDVTIEREIFAPFAKAHGLPTPTVHFERVEAPSAPTVPHASYLGASDIGAILGLDPMRTALDVWCEKKGIVTFEGSPETEAGSDHEQAVVRGFERRMRRAGLVERVEYPGPGTIIADTFGASVLDGDAWRAWRGATLDAVVHHRDHGPCALEAKYVGAGQADAWGPEPAGEEGIPIRTLVQVHWQTLHARERFGWAAPVAFVAADIGTDRRAYEIAIDDDLIDRLLEAGRQWWRRHVVGGEMPEPTERDVETLAAVFPRVRRRGLSPFPPDGLRELAEDYAVAREIALRHRSELYRVGAKLRALIGDAEGYQWRGGRVTWREDTAGDRRLRVRIWKDGG